MSVFLNKHLPRLRMALSASFMALAFMPMYAHAAVIASQPYGTVRAYFGSVTRTLTDSIPAKTKIVAMDIGVADPTNSCGLWLWEKDGGGIDMFSIGRPYGTTTSDGHTIVDYSSAPAGGIVTDFAGALRFICYVGFNQDYSPLNFTQAYFDTHNNVQYEFCDDAASCKYSNPQNFAANASAHSSVLFLPGIEASRLYDGASTVKLWEPNGDALVSQIAMNPDGSSVRDDIYTKDVIDTAYIPIKGNIYASFLVQLAQMKSDGTIADYEAIPYDWRFSLGQLLAAGRQMPGGQIYYTNSLGATTSPYIIQEVRRLASASPTGKVTIVAHSNGGLVAKALTDTLGADASRLIDKMIFVAVPEAGTPQAIGGILHGFNESLPTEFAPYGISDQASRQLGATMSSVYNLLPSCGYFSQVSDPVVTFDGSAYLAPWRTKYGAAITSCQGLHAFVADSSRPVLPMAGPLQTLSLFATSTSSTDLTYPISANETLLGQAESLHMHELDNWAPPAGVQLYEIAGWGNETLSSIAYYQGVSRSCIPSVGNSTCDGRPIPTLAYKPRFTLDGDGTVVVPSALWTASSTQVQKYWLDLAQYNQDTHLVGFFYQGHADILEVPQMNEFIKNIIIATSTVSLPNYISSASPAVDSQKMRLSFTLHSPLGLDLYDDQGRHTGISTTTGQIEEDIPGSTYRTYGDLKYISVPASTHTHLAMRGYASGSFTLDIDEAAGESVVASTTFAAVPVSTSTVATMDIPANADFASAPPLVVDEAGDGSRVLTLAPKAGSVVIPDLTPPQTAASATGTPGTNGWYVSDVGISFAATDTESGVKNTFYSLDGMHPLLATSSLVLSAEGTTTVSFYSVDNAGNQEATSSLTIKIDKTPPEAAVSIDPATKELAIEATDIAGIARIVQGTSSPALPGDPEHGEADGHGGRNRSYTITDVAGHTTMLFFKTSVRDGESCGDEDSAEDRPCTGVPGRLSIRAALIGIAYDSAPALSLPRSTFFYAWQPGNPQTLLVQSIVVADVYAIRAIYSPERDMTTVVLKKKGDPSIVKVFPGLHIVKLVTNRSSIGYAL